MANARPFSISTLQDLSNDTKNTSMRGVLGLAVEPQTFGSPGGLQVPNFGSVGIHPYTWPKWGCDIVFNNERWSGHKLQEFVWELLIEHGRTTWNKCCKLIKWFFCAKRKSFKRFDKSWGKIRFCVLGLAILLGGFMMCYVGATLVDFVECVVVLLCC
jgi:hypothetical protein